MPIPLIRTFFFILLLQSPLALANQWNAAFLDKTITDSLATFETPGMAVAVVHNGEVIYNKGFGLADIESNRAVTPNTYFRLASTSKAFTAAALSILVDEGKLAWSDRVIDYLPQFRLKDDYATAHFRIEDLLTHNSGLPGGAGDSMIWPEPGGFTRQEVIEKLRFLTPVAAYQQQYGYSNVLYITAGELIEKVSGMPFEQFVNNRLFSAMGMNCFTGEVPKSVVSNSATPYGFSSENTFYPIPRNAISGPAQMSAAAGGMVCSADQMTKWLSALLSPETLPFSEQQLEKAWRPHTILSIDDTDIAWDGTHFRGYGLGWRISNHGEYRHISHTGTLSGYQAYVVIIPELKLGAVVLNNGSNYGARGAVMQTITKMFTHPAPIRDWVEAYEEFQQEQEEKYQHLSAKPEPLLAMSINDDAVMGQYTDNWFGGLTIVQSDDTLRIAFEKMPTLKGTLEPFQDNIYLIRWDNQNAASDAFIEFHVDISRDITHATLYPYRKNVPTNHGWRDMKFIKELEK
ncbi:serine hydrolase [Alteromonas sediminis]|uniref:Serine hydrolase n=1 Tax=Alteromonas sediminis TaxID=2259342 RepID=A0A3N5Y0K2_9ALTE|nr:serine hydrolase [Alteromonas sediminis]RPJ66630.1 serine hydrolase [Alteromonas sediminis]